MLSVLKNYSFAQCALAGRAAARLSEVTGQEGFTIHRLLGFPLGEDENGKFIFYEGNYLPKDIIIVDEISMVDADLFYHLISAIKPGSKLIMLGDVGQLECIGAGNIAHDLIVSPSITSIVLDKIHRQAEESAIITDSLLVRKISLQLKRILQAQLQKEFCRIWSMIATAMLITLSLRFLSALRELLKKSKIFMIYRLLFPLKIDSLEPGV